MNPEKGMLRDFSDQTWKDELESRATSNNFEKWNDIIQESDYIEHFEKYFKNLDYFQGKQFLDVGAGFGSALHQLVKKLGASVNNIDISLDSLKHLSKEGESGAVATVHELPIADESVDGVISTNLLNTTAAIDAEEYKTIIKEMYRILRKNGTLIQSHFGDLAMPILEDEQLKILETVGFSDVDVIENEAKERMNQIGYVGGLSFIAKK